MSDVLLEEQDLFADLVGQPLAVTLLKAALNQGRLAPAYLFAGPEGVGRRLAVLRFLEGVISEYRSVLEEPDDDEGGEDE